MTPEEKELVQKDICGRLVYGIFVLVHDTFPNSTVSYENAVLKITNVSDLIDNISLNERYDSKDLFNKIIKQHKEYLEFYPYLRPMSSMTEDELNQLKELGGSIIFYNTEKTTWSIYSHGPEVYDWLKAHHFDYHGLIEKGLALEAPEGMYKIVTTNI